MALPRRDDLGEGLARNMRDALPNASFIGFTGTLVEQNDANTRAVFGGYVSGYDIQQAVIDKATVPIDYESRIAKLSLNAAELPTVDYEFEEITAGEEEDRQQKLETKWAALEALVGSEKRIRLIAESGNGRQGSDHFLTVAARLPRCTSLRSHEFSEAKKSGSRVKMICQSKPDARVFKLRCFGFTPQRGSPKLAQGKRPSGAPPWVATVTEIGALKGRPDAIPLNSAAPSGLDIPDNPPTKGVALGWHNTAPLGLKSQEAQLHNAQVQNARAKACSTLLVRLRARLQCDRSLVFTPLPQRNVGPHR